MKIKLLSVIFIYWAVLFILLSGLNTLSLLDQTADTEALDSAFNKYNVSQVYTEDDVDLSTIGQFKNATSGIFRIIPLVFIGLGLPEQVAFVWKFVFSVWSIFVSVLGLALVYQAIRGS